MDIKQMLQQMHNAVSEQEKASIADKIEVQFSLLSEHDKKVVQAVFLSELDTTLQEAEEVIKKVDIAVEISEISKYISLSKIASNYFGKSKEWLYQRIKGYNINGKPAMFTENERHKLSLALQDISRKAYEASLKIS